MLDDLHNRILSEETKTRRPRGRPPKAAPLEETVAQPVVLPDAIVAHLCPHCGRGMTPRLIAPANPNGDRRVECSLCGGRYIYRPPVVRK
jgi:hypothetical protein